MVITKQTPMMVQDWNNTIAIKSDTGRWKTIAFFYISDTLPVGASYLKWKQLASKDEITYEAMLLIMQMFDRLVQERRTKLEGVAA